MDTLKTAISIDCLFAVNFCLDLVALRLCSLPFKKEPKRLFYVLAALLALLECLACVFPAYLPSPLLVLIGFLLVWGTVGRILFALLYSCVSLWAGIFITIFMKFFKGVLLVDNSSESFTKINKQRAFWAVFALVLLVLLKIFLDKREKLPKSADLEIVFKGKALKLCALRDSGNLLKDPFSGRSVVIISKNASDKLGVCAGKLLQGSARLRIIPIKSVGYSGLLYAFIPDLVKIDGKARSVCVALDPKNRDFSGFDAIIPSNM